MDQSGILALAEPPQTTDTTVKGAPVVSVHFETSAPAFSLANEQVKEEYQGIARICQKFAKENQGHYYHVSENGYPGVYRGGEMVDGKMVGGKMVGGVPEPISGGSGSFEAHFD